MWIVEGVGVSGGIAVAIVCSGFVNIDFKGFAFFCFFGVELSASFSGDDEEYYTGDEEHTILDLDLYTIKSFSKY